MESERTGSIGRRSFLMSAGAAAALPLLGCVPEEELVPPGAPQKPPETAALGREARLLGRLERGA